MAVSAVIPSGTAPATGPAAAAVETADVDGGVDEEAGALRSAVTDGVPFALTLALALAALLSGGGGVGTGAAAEAEAADALGLCLGGSIELKRTMVCG